MVNAAKFEFGSNWGVFLPLIDEDRIKEAEVSLLTALKQADLSGKSFLDVGCGSGLFSLAAKRLGAQVSSFDADPQCVACATELRSRYFPIDPGWIISQASALDEVFLNSLKEFDIVYSWGVLHHTGDMKKAVDLIAKKVNSHGQLLISIYNDQGAASQRWRRVKWFYNILPRILRPVLVLLVSSLFEIKAACGRLVRRRNPWPFGEGARKQQNRGMSVWHDWVDWVGGYPFEVAKPKDLIASIESKGFVLEKLETCGTGWGCNEYVFRRI